MEFDTKLINSILENKCILFVGAGLSRTAGLPSWEDLAAQMIEQLKKIPLQTISIEKLDEMHQEKDYLRIASYFKKEMTPKIQFKDFMEEKFKVDRKFYMNHFLITQFPFRAIITTNYDKLLEYAYENEGKNYKKITYRNPDERLHRRDVFFILKAHGDIDDCENLILEQKDYKRIINTESRFNDFISTLFKNNTLLFIGTSLTDLDVNLILDKINVSSDGNVDENYALMANLDSYKVSELKNESNIIIIDYKNTDDMHEGIRDKLLELIEIIYLKKLEKPGEVADVCKAISNTYTKADLKVPYKILDRLFDIARPKDPFMFFIENAIEAINKLADESDIPKLIELINHTLKNYATNIQPSVQLFFLMVVVLENIAKKTLNREALEYIKKEAHNTNNPFQEDFETIYNDLKQNVTYDTN